MDNNDINNSIDGLTDESVMELYDGIIEAGDADYLAFIYGSYYVGSTKCWCSGGKGKATCVTSDSWYYYYTSSCKY